MTTASMVRSKFTLMKLTFYLRGLLPHFVSCTVVSESEGELLRRMVPNYKSIQVIPNFINVADYTEDRRAPETNTLIFTGFFQYRANYEAMKWFSEQVYPRIQASVPQVRLTITGDHRNLPLPFAHGVIMTGFVNNVRPLVASSWASLAPIQSGGGTRLKILEAMALRAPGCCHRQRGRGPGSAKRRATLACGHAAGFCRGNCPFAQGTGAPPTPCGECL